MGAWYVPEIFVPSEKRILSPAFHDGDCVPPSGFPLLPHQCAKLCAQTVSCSCLAQNSVYAFFLCDVQAAFLGRFTALKSSLHLPSAKRIKAVEEALNRWARKALDDEMPGDLFLSALSKSIEALRLKCGCNGITNRSSITFLI